jgi:drug/metabolite transporter (DMT)-like permease
MWGLYTRALAASPSTIQVNIVNTTANFVITALFGFAIFGEKLPPLWWFGAALLVSGSVIIARRENDSKDLKEEIQPQQQQKKSRKKKQ